LGHGIDAKLGSEYNVLGLGLWLVFVWWCSFDIPGFVIPSFDMEPFGNAGNMLFSMCTDIS